ncbi:6996_t:CDS:2, partial [Racocetra persica]
KLIDIINDNKKYALNQEYSSEAIQIEIENEYNNILKVVKSKYTNKIRQKTLRRLKRKYPDEKKKKEIKIENINKVLYLKSTDENMIKRQQNRDREAETYTKEYLINLSDFYEKLIDKIYSSHIKIENDCSVEEYGKNYFEKLFADLL